MTAHVFLSYSKADQAASEQICRGLELQGIKCWVASRDVKPGEDYGVQIIDAIESTRVTILILSGSANESTFVKNEVERAISKNKVVIPFRIQDVQPSRALELFISRSQWIDAWTPPMDARIQLLGTAIRGLLSLPDLEPEPATPPAPAVAAAPVAPAQPLPTPLPSATAPRRSRDPRLVGGAIAGVAGLLLVIAVVASRLIGGSSGTTEPLDGSLTVSVQAATENGIVVGDVLSGDTISIEASGQWCYGISEWGIGLCGGPGGGQQPQAADQPLLVPGARFGTLVAKIGNGSWFAVGSRLSWQTADAGPLRLAFNERIGTVYWTDNTGSVSVTVTVQR